MPFVFVSVCVSALLRLLLFLSLLFLLLVELFDKRENATASGLGVSGGAGIYLYDR